MADSTPTVRTIAMTGPALRAMTTPARSSRVYLVAVLLIMTGLTAAWSLVARYRLDSALAVGAAESFDRAAALFEVLRGRTQDGLRSQCSVLVEDPRLKATLATEGIDVATVTDILIELGRLRRAGFLLVLTPEGRVFAEAGTPELRNLDLSASTVVKHARGSSEPVVGSWVIGGKVIDLAVAAIRLDRTVLAYLVLGQAVDAALVNAVTTGTGAAVAVLAGAEAQPISATDDQLRAVLQAIGRDGRAARPHTIELGGARYLIATVELADPVPSHPRLALGRALGPERKSFEILDWLLWAPIGLLIIGVTLASQRSSSGAL
jgi:hypothetical protein